MAFLDAVRDALAPDDTKGREQLDILKKAATGELNDYLSKFLDRFKNPDGFKEEILPKRMFDQMKQYRVNLDEGASDQIAKIVDTFFEGTEEGLKNGFKEVIKFAVVG